MDAHCSSPLRRSSNRTKHWPPLLGASAPRFSRRCSEERAMPINPAARALIEAMDGTFPKLHEMPSGTEARRRIVEAMHDVEPEREPLHHVEDRNIPVDGGEIAVRIYRPNGEPDLPVVVFFHGE